MKARNTKKTASLCMILVIVLEMIICTAGAYAAAAPALDLDCTYDMINDQIIVKVSLENNPGIVGIRAFLYYDETLKIKSLKDGKMFSDSVCDVTAKGLSNNPYKMMWYSMDSDVTSDGVLAEFTFEVPDDACGDYKFPAEIDPDNTRTSGGKTVSFSVNDAVVSIPDIIYAVRYSSSGKMLSVENYDRSKNYPSGTVLLGLSDDFRPLCRQVVK